MEIIAFKDAMPDVGRKFIAFYEDGSGCNMFWRIGPRCLIDPERGIEPGFNEIESSSHWAYLPQDFLFSFERGE